MNFQFRGLVREVLFAMSRINPMRLIADFFFLMLFFVLIVAWLLAWGAYHVAGGGIHLLLVIALISVVVHFVRGRRAV